MARYLYWGVDVWLNNPLRPLEACGTSGMKAALNGALNLSIRDGWWDEWYDGENGWAIPSADGIADPDRRDDLEAHGAVRADREERRAAVLRPRRRGRPDPLGADGAAHAQVARPEGAGDADGARLRQPALRAGCATRPTGWPPTTTRRRAQLAEWRPSVLDAWPGVARAATSTRRWPATPRSARTSRCGPRWRSTGCRPRRLRARRCTARSTSRTGWSTSTTVSLKVTDPSTARAWFEGDVPLERTGAFGYTVRVLPKNDLLAKPAELGLVVTA